MSNCLRPSCLLLNRSNFFLLERAKLELQLLYQTYFSRTILRRRKSKKTNTSKKSPCNFTIEQHHFLSSISFFSSEDKWENTLIDDFCSIKSALSSGILEVKLTLSFVPKYSFFWKRPNKLVVLATWRFTTIKNIFELFSLYKISTIGHISNK